MSTSLTENKTFLRRSNEEERVNVNKADDLVDKADNILIDKVVNILADKMAADVPSMVKLFGRWKGHTLDEMLKTPAGAVLARASNKKFMNMFNLYGEYLLLGAEGFMKKRGQ
ncbi:hypothetical protein P3T76_008332 [Phytophthora citrophthora]|uniref:RxLR effector protein n=1 Tax=Phytophthora citrophthora TaxID=4793 RepID=A0AAD9GKF1_9STRA|nr:hypothetical protein P3T76_008332 [Phytophthora citrophthora]